MCKLKSFAATKYQSIRAFFSFHFIGFYNTHFLCRSTLMHFMLTTGPMHTCNVEGVTCTSKLQIIIIYI